MVFGPRVLTVEAKRSGLILDTSESRADWTYWIHWKHIKQYKHVIKK